MADAIPVPAPMFPSVFYLQLKQFGWICDSVWLALAKLLNHWFVSYIVGKPLEIYEKVQVSVDLLLNPNNLAFFCLALSEKQALILISQFFF